MIDETRIHDLRAGSTVDEGGYVLYWMQQSQRVRYNHALAQAVLVANRLNLPVLAAFGLTDSYPDAQRSHYRFLLHGLRETAAALRDLGIGFVLRRGSPPEVALGLCDEAAWLICDRGYTRTQVAWRERVTEAAPCPVTEVESDVVVPVEQASAKEEYMAVHLRKKIAPRLDRFLVPLSMPEVAVPWTGSPSQGEDTDSPEKLLNSLAVSGPDQELQCIAGESAAAERVARFISGDLQRYADDSNDPAVDCTSELSAYLHFGHLSALDVALQVRQSDAPADAKSAFLEQLIVRRELAVNFVHYNPHYERYDALPSWCLETLDEHVDDPRDPVYTFDELERGATYDRYWNAAQKELTAHGRIHNYMRMYWGKKILEWSETPQEAFATASVLNHRYQLDGRDPNGYAGVAWCFGKHDRAWKERPIFGKVRYMNANGLERKFDMQRYVDRVNQRL